MGPTPQILEQQVMVSWFQEITALLHGIISSFSFLFGWTLEKESGKVIRNWRLSVQVTVIET